MTEEIKFHIPPENGGQIVIVSYGAIKDHVIQCCYDQSDQETDFYISRALVKDNGDYWNGAPLNRRWRKMSKKEIKKFGL